MSLWCQRFIYTQLPLELLICPSWFSQMYARKNLTICQQDVFATGLKQACQQVVTMLLQGCHSQLVDKLLNYA
jgi:hypothetical protein